MVLKNQGGGIYMITIPLQIKFLALNNPNNKKPIKVVNTIRGRVTYEYFKYTSWSSF